MCFPAPIVQPELYVLTRNDELLTASLPIIQGEIHDPYLTFAIPIFPKGQVRLRNVNGGTQVLLYRRSCIPQREDDQTMLQRYGLSTKR